MNGSVPEKNNDEFSALYHQYVDDIFRFCMSKVSDRSTALDLTQDTFIRAWHYFSDESKVISHTRGLLYRIARNLVIDHHRKKKTDSLDSLLSEGFSPEESLSSHHENKEHSYSSIRRALRALSPRHCELLILRYIDELSISEISDLMEMSTNTISVNIHRALKQAEKSIDLTALGFASHPSESLSDRDLEKDSNPNKTKKSSKTSEEKIKKPTVNKNKKTKKKLIKSRV